MAVKAAQIVFVMDDLPIGDEKIVVGPIYVIENEVGDGRKHGRDPHDHSPPTQRLHPPPPRHVIGQRRQGDKEQNGEKEMRDEKPRRAAGLEFDGLFGLKLEFGVEPRQFPIKTGTALPLGRGHAPPTAEQPPQPNPPIPLRVEILLQAALAHQLLRLGRENGEHDPNEGVVLLDEVYQLVAQDDNDAAVGACLEVMGINLRLK